MLPDEFNRDQYRQMRTSQGHTTNSDSTLRTWASRGYIVYEDTFEPCDTRTPEQSESLRQLVQDLQQQYPEAIVHGHYEFTEKSCPSFRVPNEN